MSCPTKFSAYQLHLVKQSNKKEALCVSANTEIRTLQLSFAIRMLTLFCDTSSFEINSC